MIVDSAGVAVTVIEKQRDDTWRDSGLKERDTLALPEVGLESQVNELYEDTEFPGMAAAPP